MAPIDRAAFASRLGSLDRRAFAAFVADLWRARGHTAEIDLAGGVPTVSVGGDPPRTLLLDVRTRLGRPAAGRSRPDSVEPADIEAVVANRATGAGRRLAADLDARFLGPATLREMALYSLDRAGADRLLRDHLGRPAWTSGGATPRWRGLVPSAVASLRSDVRVAVLAVAALLLVAATVAVAGFSGTGAGPGLVPGSPFAAGGPTSDGTVTPAPTPTPDLSAGDADADGDGDRRFPPGIDRHVVTNASALADAHREALSGRSYRWKLRYREYDANGSVAAALTEDVYVDGRTVYTSIIDGSNRTVGGQGLIGNANLFADGEVVRSVRRKGTGPPLDWHRITPAEAERDRFAVRAAAIIRRFLPSDGTFRVGYIYDRGGTTYYQLSLSGGLAGGNGTFNGEAIVDSSGVVHELEVRYGLPGTSRTATFEFEYEAIGNTTIQRPREPGDARR